MRKKISALFLAVIMVVTLLPTAFAAENSYSDTQGHWGEDAIDRWSGYGVISGTGSGQFDPNAPLTRAQAAQIFANLLNLSATASVAQYTDVTVGSWYYDAIAKCVAAGILNGTGSNTMSPSTYVSREELFVMFARALGIQPQASAGVTFTDSASTASWAAGYINALADMGVVGGSGDGTLAPKADIDRASVVALLDKAITAYGNTSGATVGSSSGIVLVVADNVTVMGSVESLVVAGGSAGISGSTVGSISVVGESASVSVGGSANVGQVSVTGANASVTVRGEATVSGVTIADTAQGAELTVSGDATVTAVDSAAQNVTISGDGTIEAATVSGDNTTVDTNGTDLTVSEGTTGVTENDKVVSAGDSVVTEPTEDAGSSGESTTPSRPTNPSRPSYDYYTVTFMLDENTVYDTQRVREGSTVEQPVAPTKDGYRFDGWYLDGAVVAYDFTAPVENDITLTARWLANPVTVTLVEGQNIYTYQTEYGTTLNEATLNAVIEVERPYETVTGWWIDIGYNTKYDFTTVVTGDMTLYYGCTWKEYTLTFMVDGSPVSTQPVDYSVSLNNYFPACTEEGFSWTWYTDEAFTQPVASDATMPGNDLTLYGQWTHNASGLKGHGTESDPFLIADAEDLKAIDTFSDDMNGGKPYSFELLADIDMDDVLTEDWGYAIQYFCGTFEGNNHTLYASNDKRGYLVYDTISDVTIQNLTLIQNSIFVGVVAGANYGAIEGTVHLKSITVQGTDGVVVQMGNNDGSFITWADSAENAPVILEDCVNRANINAYENYAGIFIGGYLNGNKQNGQTGDIRFIRCVNYGDMTGQNVGFFTGNNCDDPDINKITIKDCANYGTLIGTTTANFFAANGANKPGTTAANSSDKVQGINKDNGTIAVQNLTELGLTVNEDGYYVITAPSTPTGIAYYVVDVYAQNTFDTGSSYAWLSERVTASAATLVTTMTKVDKMIDSTTFETNNSSVTLKDWSTVEEREDYVNARYQVVDVEGTKYMVVYSQDMIDTFPGGATTVSMNTDARYRVSAYTENGTVIGTANVTLS